MTRVLTAAAVIAFACGVSAADVIRVPDDVGSTWGAIKAIHR